MIRAIVNIAMQVEVDSEHALKVIADELTQAMTGVSKQTPALPGVTRVTVGNVGICFPRQTVDGSEPLWQRD